ncbi:MAG: MurR/RpiR family transcriptional regulator, partial [Streptococcaceae bacterium]|jgi:DNA-binding MurR/RpiR family transcriptional regulator|nr:MurR/RpiR family transcriptional regulator [Streptococcaceae bacterium]
VKNSLEYKSVAITSDPASHLATMSDVVLNYRVALNRINRYQDFTSQIPAHYIIERLLYKVQQVMKKES